MGGLNRATRARWGSPHGQLHDGVASGRLAGHLAWYAGALLLGVGVYLSSHVALGTGWGLLALSLMLLLFVAYLAMRLFALRGPDGESAWWGYAAVLLGGGAALLLGWTRGSAAWGETRSRLPQRDGLVALVTVGEVRGWMREGYVHGVRGLEAGERIAIGQRVLIVPAWQDSTFADLLYGATYLMRLDTLRDGSWRNPNAFDYAAWLRLHGVVGQVRMRKGCAVRVDSVERVRVSFPNSVRMALMSRLGSHVQDSLALGLMQAMALGERAGLGRETQLSFRQSGLAHILALSGLHVGFLYGIILFATQFIRKDRWGLRVLRYGVPLAVVWLFTLLVGASPSLLRAALMLSVVALDRVLLRRSSGFVVLSAAGVVALVLDPLTLWDAGFQLSFSALAGIFLFLAPLRRLVRTRWRGLAWLRDMVCVTLSAQLGTLPVTLSLFGALPLWSVFANVVAIPLASLVMPGALFLSLLPSGWQVGQWLGWSLGWLARGLIWSAEWVSGLPYSQLSGLTLHAWEALLVAGGLGALAFWIHFDRRWAVVCGCLLLLAPCILLAHRGVKRAGEASIVVLHRSGHTVLAVRSGVRMAALQDSMTYHTRQLLGAYGAYMPLHSIEQHRTLGVEIDTLSYGVRISHAGKRILLAQACQSMNLIPEDSVDVLLLGRIPSDQFFELVERLHPTYVVADGRTPKRLGMRMQAWCLERGVPFHSTHNDGYWELVVPMR